MTAAERLAYAAVEAAQNGASRTAVEILERAAEFAARKFGNLPAEDDPPWVPKDVPPTETDRH